MTDPEPRPRLATVALLLLVAGAALLRLPAAIEWPVAYGDAATWVASRRSLADALRWASHPDHPPLSFLLVRVAIAVTGSDAGWVIRLPSVLAGVLAVPAAYWLGTRLGSRTAGLAMAALVTVEPELLDQGRRGRMYALLALVVLLVLGWLARLERKGGGRLGWALLGAAAAVAWGLHHLGLVVAAALLLAVVVGERRTPVVTPPTPGRLRPTTGAAVASAVFLALSIPGLANGIGKVVGWSEGREVVGSAFDEGARATVAALVPHPAAVAFALGGLALLWVGLRLVAGRSRWVAWALVAMVGVSIPLTAVAAVERPFGVGRYLLLGRIALVVAAGALAGLAPRAGVRRLAKAAVVLVVLALGVEGLRYERSRRHDLGAVAEIVARERGPGDAVVFDPAWTNGIGRYYALPPEPAESAEDGWVPAGSFPYSRAWVVLHHSAVGPDGRTAVVDSLARRFAARPDRAVIGEALRRRGAVALLFEPGRAGLYEPRR